MKKEYLAVGIAVIVVAAGAGWFAYNRDAGLRLPQQGSRSDTEEQRQNPNEPPPERAMVESVIDAITIKLNTGHEVRYVGVRAPEISGQVQCFGREAMKANESVIGKEVRLEEEPLLKKSSDGTWVRYVYLLENGNQKVENSDVTPDQDPESSAVDTDVDPGSEPGMTTDEANQASEANQANEARQEIFINERILEGGFGFPVVSQDMKYGEQMLSAARFASATGKGLWGQCEVTENPGGLQTQPVEECVIKGKVAADFTRLYRTPDCSGYSQTTVIESQGGRWFCAEDIAQDAGFEKAPDCL